MPGCPLRRTCARPSDGADQDQKPKRGGLIADLMFVKVIGGEPPCHAHQKSPVGAAVRRFDLLANANWHSALMSTDRTPSRASRIVAPPLPHLIGVAQEGCKRQMSEARPLDAQVGPQAASRCCGGDRPLERPSGGSAQWATRQGCRVSRPRPWMADGGGPTEQDRNEGMASLSEPPNERGKSLWLLGAFPSDPL
ncbi:hypothetical protein SAMN04490194_3629 [Pseudomonas migulae]|uniref:Uncharacterized protein n=1 Tax=Pseudomonas migulae TaxID=78543 RepID=A0A1H5L0L3_9PSED|nr:hypothetical protein SAMN04490194_3629 [Pseudomonas migulae]